MTKKQIPWENKIVGSGTEDPNQLLANPFNFRNHPKEQKEALTGVLNEIGWIQDVIVNRITGHIIDGHLRVELAMQKGEPVPVKYVELTEKQERIALASIDPIGALAEQDQAMLDDLLDEIGTVQDDDLSAFLDSLMSGDPDGEEQTPEELAEEARETLAERFIVPPFSILDAKQGYWSERKRAWQSLGIQSELGRDDALTYAVSSQPPHVYEFKNAVEKDLGRKLSWKEFAEMYPEEITLTGTSIFDPVLTEIMYSWFCPKGGSILDPFAGGSVRGVVAGFMGYNYTGVELREEQVKANRGQAAKIFGKPKKQYKPSTMQPIRVTTEEGVRVVRDDDLLGGTKRRVMERIMRESEHDEFVYASPAIGFAQIALAAAAKDTGKKATIYVAARKKKTYQTRAAIRLGAQVIEIEKGAYLTTIQAKAREYAEQNGAQYFEFGAEDPVFMQYLAEIAKETGEQPSEVWTVAGSGVLTRSLQMAWPDAKFYAVQVGKDPEVGMAELLKAPEKFEQDAKIQPPFESTSNYDAKAWRFIQERAGENALFWNVGGDTSRFDIFQDEGEGEAIPTWINADSRDIPVVIDEDREFDLIFSCPPYADLEVYSDNPNDLSTLEYDEFVNAYTDIIVKACSKLKNNSFAVFVVGEVRGKKGAYYGFVQDTIKAFQKGGLDYYNEVILLTNIGSNAIRAAGQFTKSRKLAKGHQNALVFTKGSPTPQAIDGLSKAIADHFNDHRQVFQAYENIMVFCKGDPKKATEAIGDPDTLDIGDLITETMNGE